MLLALILLYLKSKMRQENNLRILDFTYRKMYDLETSTNFLLIELRQT